MRPTFTEKPLYTQATPQSRVRLTLTTWPELRQRKHRPFFWAISTRALWDTALVHLRELCSQSLQKLHMEATFLEVYAA